MAKKAKATKSFSKSTKSSTASKVGGAVKSALFGGKGKAGGKRRKKSALWYIKEKQRLKAKRSYEKEKMRI